MRNLVLLAHVRSIFVYIYIYIDGGLFFDKLRMDGDSDDGEANVPQIQAWLRKAGLGRFYPRFQQREMTVDQFLNLNLEEFESLGIRSPADRKRLMNAVEERRREAGYKTLQFSNNPATSSGSINLSSKGDRGEMERLGAKDAKSMRARLGAKGRASIGGLFLRASSKKKLALENSNGKNVGLEIMEKEKTQRRIAKVVHTSVVDFQNDQDELVDGPKLVGPKVSVCVRKRPLTRREETAKHKDIITAREPNLLYVHELKTKVDLTKYIETHNFQFDAVFPDTANNEDVYAKTAAPLVDVLFAGGRATCFAYGQTGAGKTYTMQGSNFGDDTESGLYSLAVQDIFDRKASLDDSQGELQLYMSFYEIYGSSLHDLLDERASLACREDANNEVQIVGLTARRCENPLEVFELITQASQCRSTGVTGANNDSSRSHAVFQVELRRCANSDGFHSSEEELVREQLLDENANNANEVVGTEVGRLCFIDLAGSERGSDTAANDRATRMEGAEINKSLLALKECIRAMDNKKGHTPFRGSKLTQVLKASFTGRNSKTVMIANVSPSSANVEDTLNTLRYADRVKDMSGNRSGVSRKENERYPGKRKKRKFSIMPQERTKSMSMPRESLAGFDGSVLRKMNSGYRPSDVKTMGPRSLSRSRVRAPLPPGVRTRSQAKKAAPPDMDTPSLVKRKPRKSCIARLPRAKGSLAKSPPREDDLAGAKARIAKLQAKAYAEAQRNASSHSDKEKQDSRKFNKIETDTHQTSRAPSTRSTADPLGSVEVDNLGDEDLLFSQTSEGSLEEFKSSAGIANKQKKPQQISVSKSLSQTSLAKSDDDSTDDSIYDNIIDEEAEKVTTEPPKSDTTTPAATEMEAPRGLRMEQNQGDDSLVRRASEEKAPNPKDTGTPETSSVSSYRSTPQADEKREVSLSPPPEGKDRLQKVIAKHKEEINGMVKLFKANAVLLDQIEDGSLSNDLYVTKLELNLAQQMDLIQGVKEATREYWERGRK